MHVRYLLSSLCQYSGLNAAAIAARSDRLITLGYHRVLDVDDPAREWIDPALVTSTHNLQRQMQIVASRFSPVGLCDVLSWLDGTAELPPRPVLVTFDDGLADTHANAFPVLERLGITATVFLATGFIGTDEAYWSDVLYGQLLATSGPDTAAREVERLKGAPAAIRNMVLDNADISPLVTRKKAKPGSNLTWPQVEELADFGWQFGSHTRSHIILPIERDEVVQKELAASANDISRRLGRAATAFAYPDGQFDGRTMRLLEQSGCKCAFTCDEGVAARSSDPLALPRLLIHDGVSSDRQGRFSEAMFLTYLSGTIPRRYRRRLR